ADADDGPHRVEEVGQDQREHQQHDGDHTRLPEGAEQAEVTDQPEVRGADDPVGPLGGGQAPGTHIGQGVDDERHHGHDDDADQDGAPHLAGEQPDGEEDAEAEHEHGPAGEGAGAAQLDRHGGAGGVRDAADEAGVDEADEGDEQADADADRLFQRLRDRPHHRLAQPRHHQQADQQALQHDQ